MSPKNSFLKASLSALGLFGIAVSGLADAPPSAPPAQAPPAAPASEPVDAVLLLSDGKVLRGKVSETPKGYLVKQRGNALPVRRELVRGVFRTIEEAYEFQAEQVHPRDPDDQLKLARWCLTNNLETQAKTHLSKVVALSPNFELAKRMLDAITLSQERAVARDSEVVRTGGEIRADMPGELKLEPRDLQGSKRLTGYDNGGIPRIFDLPPVLAVKRAEEFARFVQPVLQERCAGCHNENYAGEFQLIELKNKHDRTAAAYRANLDATLRLVDPVNPPKSELLSSGLRMHGKAPKKGRIFLGPNDRGYQVLEAWVNNFKSTRAGEGNSANRLGAPGAPGTGTEGFAVDRGSRNVLSTDDSTIPASRPGAPSLFTVAPQQIPPSRFVPGQGFVTETSPPGPDEFPVPFAVGGPKPKLNVPPVKPGTVVSPPAELPPLPGTAIPPLGTAKDADDVPKKPRKPVKIDENLLQKMLENRNNPR